MYALDRLARLHVAGTRAGSYFVFGLLGVVSGLALVTMLAPFGAASARALVVGVVAVLLGFIFAVKIAHLVFGYERLVYYEMLGAALASAAGAMSLIREPVWPTLELCILGIGAFLVWGRIGCLHVGCCHGRPWAQGIRYGTHHVAAGFTACYSGIRLFPIQLADSANSVAATAVATWTYLRPHADGEVVVTYLVAYGLGRFFLELARGDDDRPHLIGLSEAQWLALCSHLAAAVLVASGEIQGAGYLAAAAATTVAAAILIGLWLAGGVNGPLQLRDPKLSTELHRAIGELRRSADDIAVVDTPSGLRLSLQRAREGNDNAIHLALSRPSAPLSDRAAATLAGKLTTALGATEAISPIAGRSGIYHYRARLPMQVAGPSSHRVGEAGS